MPKTELILSDITRMGHGFCVIGLERTENGFRSVRPLPPFTDSWPAPFPFHRGDVIQFDLYPVPVTWPHIEDRRSRGQPKILRRVSENDLVAFLRQAECSVDLNGLFSCGVQENARGSGIFVLPGQGQRSICGCEVNNIRFEVFPDEVRTMLLLPSGVVLRDFPLVDRDWRGFIDQAFENTAGANRFQRVQRFLNSKISEILLSTTDPFARIGLTRIHNEHHWLMLDTLIPLPQSTWLNDLC